MSRKTGQRGDNRVPTRSRGKNQAVEKSTEHVSNHTGTAARSFKIGYQLLEAVFISVSQVYEYERF